MIHWLLAGAVALSFFGGWKVKAWQVGANEAAQAELANRDRVRRFDQAAAASAAFEIRREADEAHARELEQEIDRVASANRVVYDRDCLDDDGLRLLAAEIRRNPHPREPGPPLPAASGPTGQGRQGQPQVGTSGDR